MGKTYQTIVAVRNTLDKITVSGEENLDKMLGCIQALNALINKHEEEQHADDNAEE